MPLLHQLLTKNGSTCSQLKDLFEVFQLGIASSKEPIQCQPIGLKFYIIISKVKLSSFIILMFFLSSKYFVHFHTSLFRSKCSSFFLSSCSPISFLIPSASICKTEGSRFLGSADELQPYKYKQPFVKTREKQKNFIHISIFHIEVYFSYHFVKEFLSCHCTFSPIYSSRTRTSPL